MLAALLLASLGCERPPPPDVLLITLDTLRVDAVGAYGAADPTPALDGLAAQGVRYDRAYTPAPMTIPAHASLHTGAWPPRHGVRDNGDYFLGEEAETLAERLGAAGYATAACVGAMVTARQWGFDQGFDAYFDDMGAPEGASRWQSERPGDAVVDDALGWLAQQDSQRPWFLWVHLFDAHHPYKAPEPYRTQHRDNPYLGEVAWTDSLVARLLAAVDPARTLVIVAGDHGEALGDHGEPRHGVLLYDPTTRIPLILRPPGGRAPAVVSGPVSLVDIAPTVLAAAGAGRLGAADGIELGLEGDEPRREAVYLESRHAWRRYGWAPQYGLVTAEYKLIDSTTPELYAAGDAAEERDLAGSQAETLAALRGQLAALREGLERDAAGTPAGGTPASLTGEQSAQLEALGYVTAAGDPATAEGLPDPAARVGTLEALAEAERAFQQGRLAQARTILEQALAEDPGMSQPRNTLAQVLRRQGMLVDALAAIEEADRLQPTSTTRSNLGRIELDMGRVDDGLAHLEEALEMDPARESTWKWYLVGLFLDGRFKELEAALERARVAAPGAPAVRSMGAHLAIMKRGDLAAAEAELEAVLAIEPDHPLAHYGLGVLCHLRGDLEGAERHLKAELETNPRASFARKVLVGIYKDSERADEAAAVVDECLDRNPRDALCRWLSESLKR